jgi:enoyl-CoA hydratase/carnithine racemase
MGGELVTLDVDDATRVAVLELQRPPMNPISSAVAVEVATHVEHLVADDACRALVVWGGADMFAAGADVKEFPDWGPDEALAASEKLHRANDAIANAPFPSIAALTGYALGGGFELALACDFRVATPATRVGFPEVLLGLLPGAGGTVRLARLVGPTRAKEMVFSGRMLDMDEAHRLGIVERVLNDHDDLLDAATRWATDLAAGPAALRLARRAIDEGTGLPLEDALALERHLFAEAFGTQDKQIGVQSFLDDGPGKATFVGR